MSKPIAALVALSLASPALGTPYLAAEAGIARAKDNDIDVSVEYTTTPGGASQPIFYDDTFAAVYERGVELGVAAGYDFGWFRLEGELGHKRVGIDRVGDDDITGQFLGEFNSALNRPSADPDPGAPALPALTLADFQQGGTLNVSSAMVNGMLDLGVIDRVNIYAGLGFGRSFVRGYGDRDGAIASQRFAGARYAVSDRFEVAFKYRKFSSGIIKLNRDPIAYSGNPDQVTPGGPVTTTNAALTPDIEGEFRTKNFLFSLVYNLR